MDIVGTIISAQNEPNKSGEGESFKVRFRASNGKDWAPLTLFDDGLKEKATELKGKVNSAKLTVEKPEGGRFWDLKAVEAVEPAEATYSRPSGNGDGIDIRCAAIIVKDLRVAEVIKDDNLLVIGLKKWLGTQLNAWPETPPVEIKKRRNYVEAPTYKDTSGNDPSKATEKNIVALKDLLGVFDDEDLDTQIALRFGYGAVMSDAECKDWIKELKSQ